MSEPKDELARVTTTSRIKRDSIGTITLTVLIGIESKIHLEPGFEVEWDIDGDRLILTPKFPSASPSKNSSPKSPPKTSTTPSAPEAP